ncbi:delta-lactam-biosynthetic de-N-acetylase [Paenibacillus sp. GCM10027627]|uniref:delta-lactam-biosynthetic de-N-acetylase n=1 Tax=unclassified Paenibacillus TaxID=185978 RepID=UPI00362A4C8D
MRTKRISGLLIASAFVLAAIWGPQAIFAQPGAFHFGFKKSVEGRLPSIDEEGFKPIITKHGALFLGDTSRKDLFLTFDNGYENGLTAKILDVLKEKQVPATFFVTGHYIKDQPELLKRMAAEGHIIGNHSWSHPDMTQLTDEMIRSELAKVKEQVTLVTGQQQMDYLRPPRGIFNEKVLASSKNSGYTSVFWSIAYKDWDVRAQKGASYAFQQVTKQLHPGAILLLHSVSQDNADALGSIIDEARRQGYEFKSLSELTTAPEGDPSEGNPTAPVPEAPRSSQTPSATHTP